MMPGSLKAGLLDYLNVHTLHVQDASVALNILGAADCSLPRRP